MPVATVIAFGLWALGLLGFALLIVKVWRGPDVVERGRGHDERAAAAALRPRSTDVAVLGGRSVVGADGLARVDLDGLDREIARGLARGGA